jgi:hypothetical protein
VIIMTRLIDRVPLALLHECRLLADSVAKSLVDGGLEA